VDTFASTLQTNRQTDRQTDGTAIPTEKREVVTFS